MFYGTNFIYNFLYFFTAMSPAYFLFLLKLNEKFEKELTISIEIKEINIKLNVYIFCLILLILVVISSLILSWLLRRSFIKQSGTPVTLQKTAEYKPKNIEDSNGNVISFLLGSILPVVIIIENSLSISLIVFFILQLILFILMRKSSDIFPNIILIINGIDLCKMENGDYLFVLKGNSDEINNVIQLGDASKSKLHITAHKK